MRAIILRVLFRVDAAKHIGTGHVSRCLTLATALKKHGSDIHFCCLGWQNNLNQFIQQQNFSVSVIAANKNLSEYSQHAEDIFSEQDQRYDATSFINSLSPKNQDLVIVDHYGLDACWQRQVRETGCKMLVIDDLANRTHYCHFLLDQNLHAFASSRYLDLVPENCQLILGPKYALLRSEFYSMKKNNFVVKQKVDRLLVYLGYIDPLNTTMKVLNAIDFLQIDTRVEFVLSPIHPHYAELHDKALNMPTVTLHIQPINMDAILPQMDMVIGAGGSATWERCSLGIPTLLIALTNNQEVLAKELAIDQAVEYLGPAIYLDSDIIGTAITNMVENKIKRQTYSIKSQTLVDALGADRVCAKLLTHLAKDNKAVFLKQLKQCDASMVYDWQHEPHMRKHCRIDAPPDKKEHELWINSRVQSSDLITKIIFHDRSPVGMIRLDKLEGINALEVSILLTTRSRNLGVAKVALKILIARFKDHPIHAYIVSGNITSQHLFSNLGFEQLENGNWWILDKNNAEC